MIKYLSIPLQEIARYQFPKSTPISLGKACEINMLACGELESYTLTVYLSTERREVNLV